MSKLRQLLLNTMRDICERHIAQALKSGNNDPLLMMQDILSTMMRGQGRLPALAMRFTTHPSDILSARRRKEMYFEATGDLLTPALTEALAQRRKNNFTPGEVRPYTYDEQIVILAEYLQDISGYWQNMAEDENVTLSGTLHSFLSLTDGNNGQWPGLLISSKSAYLKDFNADFGGHLHEKLYEKWEPGTGRVKR